jgi:hypothetical protein
MIERPHRPSPSRPPRVVYRPRRAAVDGHKEDQRPLSALDWAWRVAWPEGSGPPSTLRRVAGRVGVSLGWGFLFMLAALGLYAAAHGDYQRFILVASLLLA